MTVQRNARPAQTDDGATDRKLRVTMFGAFEVRLGDRVVTIANRKCRAIIALLALAERGTETRERLVGLLWSESDEERARASLRQSLYEIREAVKAVGFHGLHAEKLAAVLEPDSVQVDVLEALSAARSGRTHPQLEAGSGTVDALLAELESVDPAFATWLVARRQTLQTRLSGLLSDALRRAATAPPESEKLARALLNLDATNEEAARALIRARAAAGDVGGALGVYKGLWDLLDEEYDIEPSKETQELIAEIKMGGAPPPVAESRQSAIVSARDTTTAATRSGPMRIVLSLAPFDVTGTRPAHRYLVNGFRRELIATLVRFREWIIRDQPAAEAMVRDPLPAESYTVEASAFDTVDSVRLVLMLRDVASGAYLWSERLQLSIEGWFDAQQVAVRRIAAALNLDLSAGRLARVAAASDSGLIVYDRWLRAQELTYTFSPEGWLSAERLYREIIAENPLFGRAYTGLATQQNLMHIAQPGIMRSRRRAAESLELAREAVRLDPVDSRAQLCLGWSHVMAGEYDAAESHFNMAYDLNDNDPWTGVSSAHGIAFCGAAQSGRERADRSLALTLSPSRAQWAFQVGIRFLAGDYAGCVEAADLARDHILNLPGWKASSLAWLDREAEAKAELRRFVELIGKNWRGSEPASEEAVTRWFLHLFPIASSEDWERLRDGFCRAGAPKTERMTIPD